MTQELIFSMLGVRREGVTEATLKIQATGLISYTRGRVKVLDRAGLDKRSCECYDVVKVEYDPPAAARDGGLRSTRVTQDEAGVQNTKNGGGTMRCR